MAAAPPPVMTASVGWATRREALALVVLRTTLRRTMLIALVVGTVLSIVNQAGVILDGHATTVTWLRVGANYLVPFCVSNAGFLSATRAPVANRLLGEEHHVRS